MKIRLFAVAAGSAVIAVLLFKYFGTAGNSMELHKQADNAPKITKESAEAARVQRLLDILKPDPDYVEIQKAAHIVRQDYLEKLSRKEVKSACDYVLLALNSTGEKRTDLLKQWIELDRDNAAPHLLLALDQARAGNLEQALVLANEAVKLPRIDDYASSNRVTEARLVSKATGKTLIETYVSFDSTGDADYYRSASDELRQLGEIMIGDLLDSDHKPTDEDQDRWRATLTMANKVSSTPSQTVLMKRSALEAERTIVAGLPERFAELLDRPKTLYVQELAAEAASLSALSGVYIRLRKLPEQEGQRFVDLVQNRGEVEALQSLGNGGEGDK